MLPATIARVLELTLSAKSDPATQLLDYLTDKELLLVLDNFEQLTAGGADFLGKMLRHAPHLKLLVTSRQQLQLQEEVLLPLDGLTAQTACQLFVQTVQRHQPAFDPSQNEEAVAEICRLVGGSPLAIELAAVASRTLPCAYVATAIQESFGFVADEFSEYAGTSSQCTSGVYGIVAIVAGICPDHFHPIGAFSEYIFLQCHPSGAGGFPPRPCYPYHPFLAPADG